MEEKKNKDAGKEPDVKEKMLKNGFAMMQMFNWTNR